MRKDLAMVASLGVLLGAAPALAQQTPRSDPQVSPPAAVGAPIQSKAGDARSDSQTESLVGLPVYSSDEQQVGEVSAVDIGGNGMVDALDAEVGDFLGIGQRTVRITSDKFARDGDRILLSMTADEVGALPAAAK